MVPKATKQILIPSRGTFTWLSSSGGTCTKPHLHGPYLLKSPHDSNTSFQARHTSEAVRELCPAPAQEAQISKHGDCNEAKLTMRDQVQLPVGTAHADALSVGASESSDRVSKSLPDAGMLLDC